MRVPRPPRCRQRSQCPALGLRRGSWVTAPRPRCCPYPRAPPGIASPPSRGLLAASHLRQWERTAGTANAGSTPPKKSMLDCDFPFEVVSGEGKISLPPPCARTRLGTGYWVVCARVIVLSKVVSMVQLGAASHSCRGYRYCCGYVAPNKGCSVRAQLSCSETERTLVLEGFFFPPDQAYLHLQCHCFSLG